MSTSMMSLKLGSSVHINLSLNLFSFNFKSLWNFTVKFMEYTSSYFDNVDNLEFSKSLNLEWTCIVKLSSRSGIESRLVEDQQVSLVSLKNVCENIKNSSCEFWQLTISVVHIYCLRNVNGVVKNFSRCYSSFFLTESNFIVEVSRLRSFSNFSNFVCGNTPWSHGNNPVIDWKFVLFLFKESLKVLCLGIVSGQPSFVLDLNDLIETFVFSEFSENSF